MATSQQITSSISSGGSVSFTVPSNADPSSIQIQVSDTNGSYGTTYSATMESVGAGYTGAVSGTSNLLFNTTAAPATQYPKLWYVGVTTQDTTATSSNTLSLNISTFKVNAHAITPATNPVTYNGSGFWLDTRLESDIGTAALQNSPTLSVELDGTVTSNSLTATSNIQLVSQNFWQHDLTQEYVTINGTNYYFANYVGPSAWGVSSQSDTNNISGLTPGSTYTLTFTMPAGYTGAVSLDLIYNVVYPPSTPTNTGKTEPTSLVPNGSNVFNWNASTVGKSGDTITYTLQYQDVTASGAWTNIVTGVTGTTYTWNGSQLIGGHRYNVQVIAVESNGQQSSGDALVSNMMAGSPPTAPPYFNASIESATEIQFSWGASSSFQNDPVTYQLQYQQGSGSWTNIASGISATTYDWKNFALPSGYYNFMVTPTDTTLNLAGSSTTINNVYIPQGGASVAIRGASGVNLVNVLMVAPALPSVVPHQTVYTGLCQDKVTGELLLFVATHYTSDSGQAVDFTNADGNLAFDVFHLNGRPLIKDYAGVTN